MLDLNKIRADHDAATGGEWYWHLDAQGNRVDIRERGNLVMDMVRWGFSGAAPRFNVDGIMVRADEFAEPFPGKAHHAGWKQTVTHPTARAIVTAHNAMTELLDRLESAEARLRRLGSNEQFDQDQPVIDLQTLDPYAQEIRAMQRFARAHFKKFCSDEEAPR